MGNRLGAIHAGRRDLNLDDETYRNILWRVTGKRSSKQCSEYELGLVLNEMRRLGFKPKPKTTNRAGRWPMAMGSQESKARALWIALYHMNVIRDPSERALARFAERITGKAALQWQGPGELSQVIEGLRAMCERNGFKVPDQDQERDVAEHRRKCNLDAVPGAAAKSELLKVLWRKLIDEDIFEHGLHARLDTWMRRQTKVPVTAPEHVPGEWYDRLIESLGNWLRKVRATRGT